MDFSEKWGTDVDEAVRLALIDLKLTIDDVNVIVLEEPSKGFFGIGSKLAKVRVEKKTEKTPEKEKPAPAPVVAPLVKAEEKKEKVKTKEIVKEAAAVSEKPVNNIKREARQKKDEVSTPVQERPKDLVEVKEHAAITFLNDVTSKMGLTLQITAMENDSSVYVDIEGRDSGTVIGKRGQTLDAIQYLTSLVVNKDKEKYVRVVVDAENYRTKREKTLEQLANRLADKVVRSKKSVRLEPMNPYERKVIHATLQSNPQVTTRSEGEEPYRRVIIELK